ncbi:MAG: peroxiredoxin-like family protein [Planctomycetota bacterium]
MVLVGSGEVEAARAFAAEHPMPENTRLLVDPELEAFSAAELKRGVLRALGPKLPFQAMRALGSGARQGAIAGDPWQLGGSFALLAGGECVFEHRCDDAGAHAAPREVLAALAAALPSKPKKAGRSKAKHRERR